MVTAPPWLRRFLALLPLLALLVAASRAMELARDWPAGLSVGQSLSFLSGALCADLLATLRYLPLLALVLWPVLRCRSQGLRGAGTLAVVALLLVARGLLAQYRATAGVPLGADLFGYSWQDIRQTLGGASPDPLFWLPLAVLALAAGWHILRGVRRETAEPGKALLPALLVASAAAWTLAALGWKGPAGGTEHLRALRQNTLAFFIDETLSKSLPQSAPSRNNVPLGPHPFLHDEAAPDILGPLMDLPSRAPDFVFIIVEGLGRSYSGPDARLGSFTPFLDSLAAESLYWDNFIAPQGRTFAVLPSLLGSMPFGSQGVLEMPAPLPAHANLPMLLKGLGYQSRFFSGFDAAFDHERTYLETTGFDQIIDRGRIPTARSIANEWGYDDDLLLKVARDTRRDPARPTLDVIQTISMHDPFRVPDQAKWDARVESRLAELGITGNRAEAWLAHRKVYASILFADDALRRHFETLRKDPAWAHTLFVITGDHRLPEIPMDERLERYHVPLLVWSPMLRAPARIKGVSSQFDVLPTLAALLSAHYGLERPARTSWLGRGLDLSPTFRMQGDIPLKQTKVEPPEWLSGGAYLSQTGSWTLRDGLRQDGMPDGETRKRLESGLAAFRAANADFAATRQLQPEAGAPTTLQPKAAAVPATSTQLAILGLRVSKDAAGRTLLAFSFENRGDQPAVLAAPLAVVVDEQGGEHGESYGQAVQLAPKERIDLQLPLDTARLGAGRHYVSIFPSDPDTGKRIGEGQFKVPLDGPR